MACTLFGIVVKTFKLTLVNSGVALGKGLQSGALAAPGLLIATQCLLAPVVLLGRCERFHLVEQLGQGFSNLAHQCGYHTFLYVLAQCIELPVADFIGELTAVAVQ